MYRLGWQKTSLFVVHQKKKRNLLANSNYHLNFVSRFYCSGVRTGKKSRLVSGEISVSVHASEEEQPRCVHLNGSSFSVPQGVKGESLAHDIFAAKLKVS